MSIPDTGWRPSSLTYHQSNGWSSTSLRLALENPSLAYLRYVVRDPLAQVKPGPALTLGSLVGDRLLTPDSFEDQILIATVGRNTKTFAALEEANPDRLVVTQEEMAKANRIAQSILEPRTRHAEVAHALLLEGEGQAEWAYRYEDNGLPLRNMIDRVRVMQSSTGELAIVELKTTRDPTPEGFGRGASKFLYDEQAIHNLRGLRHAGAACDKIFFVAVRNEIPHEVYTCEMKPEDIEAASVRVEKSIDLTRRRLAGELPWCAKWEELKGGIIPKLELPKWHGKTFTEPAEETGGENEQP